MSTARPRPNATVLSRIRTDAERAGDSDLLDTFAEIDALKGELRDAARIRDENADRAEVLEHEHNETRGYRQHAEQLLEAERSKVAKLQVALRFVLPDCHRCAAFAPKVSFDGAGDPVQTCDEHKFDGGSMGDEGPVELPLVRAAIAVLQETTS